MTVTAVERKVSGPVAPSTGRDRQGSTGPQALGAATREIVPLVVEALARRVPFDKLRRIAAVDVIERVRVAADSVPYGLAQTVAIRRVRTTRPEFRTAEVTVILVHGDVAAFLALTLRWWRLEERWVAAGIEFGWRPDTENRSDQIVRTRRAVHEFAEDDDAALDRRMAMSSRWNGVVSRTTFTVTLLHRSDAPVGGLDDAADRIERMESFGAGCVQRTETLSGIELGRELRRAGIETSMVVTAARSSRVGAYEEN